MGESSSRLTDPKSKRGTIHSILTAAFVLALGILLLVFDIVGSPTFSIRSFVLFVMGGFLGGIGTVLFHSSHTARQIWSRYRYRFVILLVVFALVWTAVSTGSVTDTAIFVFVNGLIVTGAIVRLLLYFRMVPTANTN